MVMQPNIHRTRPSCGTPRTADHLCGGRLDLALSDLLRQGLRIVGHGLGSWLHALPDGPVRQGLHILGHLVGCRLHLQVSLGVSVALQTKCPYFFFHMRNEAAGAREGEQVRMQARVYAVVASHIASSEIPGR